MPIIARDPDAIPSLSFFGDASSRDRAFMVAGGIAIAGGRLREIEAHVADLREEAGIKSEFHWANYRGGKRRAAYEGLVKYAFELVNARKAELHIIIAKFEGYNHKAREGENKDTSINRMYYLLLLHRIASYYGRTRAIHVRLDAGGDCKDICALRGAVCAAAYSKYATRPNCVRTIEPVDSMKSGLVQMADVLVGAIAAKRNAVEHTSPKKDLADFVLKASGRHSWEVDTAMNARGLTVWNHVTAG